MSMQMTYIIYTNIYFHKVKQISEPLYPPILYKIWTTKVDHSEFKVHGSVSD